MMMKCPFGCSHHTFPNRFNFCPYCGSQLENDTDKMDVHTKNVSKYENIGNKYGRKKDAAEPFSELTASLKGD